MRQIGWSSTIKILILFCISSFIVFFFFFLVLLTLTLTADPDLFLPGEGFYCYQ